MIVKFKKNCPEIVFKNNSYGEFKNGAKAIIPNELAIVLDQSNFLEKNMGVQKLKEILIRKKEKIMQ